MHARTRIGLLVGLAVLGTALLHLTGVLSPIEGVVRAMLLPVARVFSVAGSATGDATRLGPNKKALQDRLTELEARLNTMTVDYVQLKALEEENRSLKALAKFINGSGYDFVPARVIARSGDPQSALVTIDRGSKDGIEIGMAVVVGDGIFVGKVTEIRERIAIVTLVSDERSRVAASSAGGHQLFGVVEGGGNNTARLTLVPLHEPLKKDDVIVTAGTEEKIPPNLSIGLVNEVEEKQTDPFKQASIEPLANADQLDLLLVVRPAALRPENEKTSTP